MTIKIELSEFINNQKQKIISRSLSGHRGKMIKKYETGDISGLVSQDLKDEILDNLKKYYDRKEFYDRNLDYDFYCKLVDTTFLEIEFPKIPIPEEILKRKEEIEDWGAIRYLVEDSPNYEIRDSGDIFTEVYDDLDEANYDAECMWKNFKETGESKYRVVKVLIVTKTDFYFDEDVLAEEPFVWTSHHGTDAPDDAFDSIEHEKRLERIEEIFSEAEWRQENIYEEHNCSWFEDEKLKDKAKKEIFDKLIVCYKDKDLVDVAMEQLEW